MAGRKLKMKPDGEEKESREARQKRRQERLDQVAHDWKEIILDINWMALIVAFVLFVCLILIMLGWL